MSATCYIVDVGLELELAAGVTLAQYRLRSLSLAIVEDEG